MADQKEEINAVHALENWRQRIDAEQAAAFAWKGNWGFLAAPNSTAIVELSRAEIDETLAKVGPCYDYLRRRHAAQAQRTNSRRSMGEMIAKDSDSVTSSRQPTPSGKKTPVDNNDNLMTAHEALMLQPQYLQGVGDAIRTPGVDPQDKYRFPLTSANAVGWGTKKTGTLEFFGVSQYGRKASNW
eukprot:CAMPEP_0175122094 /NCGR_PEP_ID=MMETSP0087-20121206/1531_1 /TAXON_ID=136419 /ORGANISM="Unknown Unknown, Strain D1" /LENGTH=184 /DNA_ID=CAMNT_0016403705 /DNA_START=20 /DNA_END=571 /DNA_ORIENTATION=-